ncbi:50S ribosomal protein L18Ae [Candidatus Marsarchaeota archaeon]|jgi:ribosomal protein L20A (L18A)|nr:50S ribosomal protein L18Ae [Candidatus Marsarchaeota archaeon]
MKYIVRGTIKRGSRQKFELEIEANSEKHATESALVKIGSKQGLSKSMIAIKEVVEAK